MENNIKIQINHKEPITNNILSNILFEQIGEEYNIRLDDIIMLFDFNNCNLLPNGSLITIITFSIPEIELRDVTLEEIIFTFIDSINNMESIISVVKFNDTVLEEKAFQYYKEIISLEMDMRSVLTYIITYDNKIIDDKLLKDFSINKSQNKLDVTYINKSYENILYYIYFSDYSQFTKTHKLKPDEILNLLQEPSISTFDKFKDRLKDKGINEERHLNFLSSIFKKLQPLENMRNAIMHIRNLSKTTVDNYDKSVYDIIGEDGIIREKGIKSIISDFWNNEKIKLEQKTFMKLAELEINKIFENADIEGHRCIIHDDITNGVLDEEYDELETIQNDIISYIDDEINILDYTITESDTEQLNSIIEELWNI